MATIAKKHILEVEDESERGEEDCKRRRVQFDDKVEIIINQGIKNPELSSSANGEYKLEEVDWLLQLVNDVDQLDNNTSSAGEEQKAVEEVHHKESSNMSPSSSTQCYDGIKEEPLLRVSSTNNIVEDTLKVSIAACCYSNMQPTPLITPPSSPRRIRTLSVDGLMEEEATVCEWPCNLTVDNALMAASSFSGDESSGDTK